ncbi:hypothetical protein GH714_023801 [Hevea brasiliensis]|uniref:Alpha/beta hydrolase fold-3 domain-containing protein n=1 Tax=Hevea brasiliensis TaxID=3981 RepID=A0A6A6KM41_HEVBR|nr:hypothetical protein GH714_023801 [Hevea brasiliensis]
MEPNPMEVAHDFSPFIRVYEDGRVERLHGTEIMPPSIDHEAGVKNGNVLVVVIPYRKAPEHPLPIAYDDACDAVKWVASHVNGDGPETWINQHADFEKMFLVGDSAGANITHNVGIRFGLDEGLLGVKIAGMVLVHPFFGKSDDQRSKLLEFLFPTLEGTSDPRINPVGAGVDLRKLGFLSKILVCVAGADQKYKDRGVSYYEAVKTVGGVELWRLWRLKERTMGFICLTPTVIELRD